MRLLLCFCWICLGLGSAQGAEPLRVAVVGNAAPMSFVDERGRLTGFNVELARELCDALEQACEFKLHDLNKVIAAVASDQVDFAVVSLLATPERRKQVLFTRPLYRSLSVWLSSQPFPGATASSLTTAVVRGSAQHAYASAKGWRLVVLDTHAEVSEVIASGAVQAALLPMSTAINVIGDKRFAAMGWHYTLNGEQGLSGEVAISVSPKKAALQERLNGAIDKLKRNGRFDQINTQFLPFKLQ